MSKPSGSAAGRVLVTAWVIVAAGVIPIPGPAGGTGAAEAGPVDTLTIAYPLEPDTLNPYATHIPAVGDMGLAEGFVTNDDKMRYTRSSPNRCPCCQTAACASSARK